MPPRRRRRLSHLLLAFLPVAGGLSYLVSTNNEHLKAKLRAQGERFTLEEIGLTRPSFEDPAQAVLESVRPATKLLKSNPSGAGYNQMRSRSPWVLWRQPVLYSAERLVLDWNQAAATADRIEPILHPLHELLRDPPADSGRDYTTNGIFDWTHVRRATQTLYDLSVIELRRGQLSAAHANLLSLCRAPTLYRADPALVSQMIRVALSGLATEAIWQGLQTNGWTDDQLRVLQDSFAGFDLLTGMAQAFEFERVSQLIEMETYRRDGPIHLRQYYKLFGTPPPAAWREHLAYSYWRLFRRRSGERELILSFQTGIDRNRGLAGGVGWIELPPAQEFKPPGRVRASVESWLDKHCGGPSWRSMTGTPNFVRAAETAVANETKRRLAITALALARHHLAHGRYPDRLDDCVPRFLPAVLMDPIDGRPLRYRREDPRFPKLYSIGFDGIDDGGQENSPDEPDWVWHRSLN